MPTEYDFYGNDCPWFYFDSSYKILLGVCLILFGLFGVLLNGWLFATFFHSHLLTLKSHILVLNLCSASLARNLLGFPFGSSSAFAKRWLFGTASCQFYAFLNQFLGVFQIAAFIVFILERYYQAKHFKNDKQMDVILYWAFIGLCWLYSFLLASPPLFGFGAYSCDVTSTVCSYVWPSTSSGAKQFTFSVLLVILGGFIPAVIIFYYIVSTITLERRYYKSEHMKEKRMLTKSIHAASIITFVLWVPALVLAAWQWIPLLTYGYQLHIPPTLVILAPVASEAATSVPVLCYLVGDERLRAALMGRIRKQYALLRPDRAKRYMLA